MRHIRAAERRDQLSEEVLSSCTLMVYACRLYTAAATTYAMQQFVQRPASPALAACSSSSNGGIVELRFISVTSSSNYRRLPYPLRIAVCQRPTVVPGPFQARARRSTHCTLIGGRCPATIASFDPLPVRSLSRSRRPQRKQSTARRR